MMLPIFQIESNLFGTHSCVVSHAFFQLQISVLCLHDSEFFRPYILIFFYFENIAMYIITQHKITQITTL